MSLNKNPPICFYCSQKHLSMYCPDKCPCGGKHRMTECTIDCWCKYRSSFHLGCHYCQRRHGIDPCIICSQGPHAPRNCPLRCPCMKVKGINDNKLDHYNECFSLEEIHQMKDHVCKICAANHLEDSCPNKCPCGVPHQWREHICKICYHYHLEDNCPDKCHCGRCVFWHYGCDIPHHLMDLHKKDRHKCFFCHRIHEYDQCIICEKDHHAPKDCPLRCPCFTVERKVAMNGIVDECIDFHNHDEYYNYYKKLLFLGNRQGPPKLLENYNVHTKYNHLCKYCLQKSHYDDDCPNRQMSEKKS